MVIITRSSNTQDQRNEENTDTPPTMIELFQLLKTISEKVNGLFFFQEFATAEFAKINGGEGTNNQGGNGTNDNSANGGNLNRVEKELILLMVKAADLEIRDPRIDQGVGSTSGIRACALRYFDLEVMELENTQNNALAKLPMLKLGEYEMWEIRIKQYFQIQDYALWEVIENGNSWVPIPVTAPESGPSTALKMTVPSTAEEKICKKNDVKARSLLLMALPNEHQLT
ncbi:hypothetical protein Tco_0827996, partial [Tanacetum coccineum]